ncbi:MAG: S8 family serine peptidase [Burkholderiaceae bacterium]|nr:S8 family serine peptidase [Rhodoferax sp.]MCP5286246.1 S8 family serine peptidase [Burkholderiaceae bacterium]
MALGLLVGLVSLSASAQLNERTRSFYITQTKAGKSQNAGYTGAGVLVAVVDTGVLQTHPEFAGRLRKGKSFTGQGDQTVANDANGHGTHVAGIIAAARNNTSNGIMGMAYAATILPVKVLKKDGSGSTDMINAGLRFATSKGAPIINMSLGAPSAFDPAAFQAAVAAGQLIVAAAGNDGLANPAWPARFAKENWANGQIIAVGAVDAANVIASFSNRAGDTANWFVVAPGVDIRSTYLNNGYARLSGTSMAAPVVTGAAAMIKGRWKSMTAAQIADLLFRTATDLGAPGVDAVYGHGLINVEAAMAPVGGLTASSANGSTVDVGASALQTSTATAGLQTLASQGLLQLVAFDSYRRDYAVDLGAVVQPAATRSAAAATRPSAATLRLSEFRLIDGTQLRLATSSVPARPTALGEWTGFTKGPSERLLAMDVESMGNGTRGFAGFGLADRHFGVVATGTGRSLEGTPGLADPYLALLPQAAYAGVAGNLAGTWLRVGWLHSGLRGAVADQYGPGAGDVPGARAAAVDVSRDIGHRLSLTAAYRHALEGDTLLGASGRGALTLGQGARTEAMGIGLAWQPTEDWTLGARWSTGRTPGHDQPSQLIRAFSEQRTSGWALALGTMGRWHDGDRLSVSLEQPLRTDQGTLTLDAPQAVDAEGRELRQVQMLSMVPSGREHRLTVGYGVPLHITGLAGERIAGWLDLQWVLRQQPDHQADRRPETGLSLRWQTAF